MLTIRGDDGEGGGMPGDGSIGGGSDGGGDIGGGSDGGVCAAAARRRNDMGRR